MKGIRRCFVLQLLLGTLITGALGACAPAPDRQSDTGALAIDSVHDGRIIGGQDATGEEDFSKTIVSLINVRKGALCTASIYSDTFVITAAHCLSGALAGDLKVVFGKDIKNRAELVVRTVDFSMVSPSWWLRQSQEFNTGDIGIVRFKGGLAPGYKPAQFLEDVGLLKDNQPVVLAGYGLSDGVGKTGDGRLRFVETTILKADFSSTEVLVDQSQGKGACHGDSGGPAYVNVNGQLYLWGVTSRGVNDRKDDCSVSAAYTRIPSYSSWIAQTTKFLTPH